MVSSEKRIKAAIIDYQMGNMFSVRNACTFVGLEAHTTSVAADLMKADMAILPGVGAFGDAMNNLKRLDLIEPIIDFINSGRPFVGICLGLQLLMSESEEFGVHKGLNVIAGSVEKFSHGSNNGRTIKVPQVGWNRIYKSDQLLAESEMQDPYSDVRDGEYMYFVHSFYAQPATDDVVMTTTNYEGTEYCSSLHRDNVFAFQFHPEKSGKEGIKIYQNLVSMMKQNKEVLA